MLKVTTDRHEASRGLYATAELLIVGWKPIIICIDFLGRNINFSGKTQAIWTKFGIRGQVKGWQRSGNFGCDRPILAKMGAGTSPAEPKFFCLVNHATFRQRNGQFSPNLATKRISVFRRWIRKDIFENFHFRGHFPPKSEIENRSNMHQPTAQGLHRRIIPIFPCDSRRSKWVPSGSGIFLRLLIGSWGPPKLAQIFACGKWLYPYRMQLHIASDSNGPIFGTCD